jgi:hypothetical protein
VYEDMWVWDRFNRKMHLISLKNIVYNINYSTTVYHMSFPNQFSFTFTLKRCFPYLRLPCICFLLMVKVVFLISLNYLHFQLTRIVDEPKQQGIVSHMGFVSRQSK